MWNRLRRRRFSALTEILAVGLVLGGIWFWWPHHEPRVVDRANLELRGGVLCVRGETPPFDGLLVENYPSGTRKLSIEIHRGLANGPSLGWFENGQMEVEETFTHGVSDGLRTRWYADGHCRSTASIVQGRLDGLYQEWHPNGGKAVEITFRAGKPEGEAKAWSEAGAAKSSRFYRGGVATASAAR